MLKRLHAPAWAWLALAAGLGLFATLGTWQLGRGLDKLAWVDQFNRPAGEAELLGPGAPAPAPAELRRAAARGTYDPARQLLQDGQAREGRPGFHVWTPLRLSAGGVVLVNRGWIPQPPRLDRLVAPDAPAGELLVQGWWRALPEPAVRVGGDECLPAGAFPAPVVYPTAAQLECLLGEPVRPGLLLLDAGEPGGFVREWQRPGFPPERHFGYAVTWYALGLTALVLFIKLNWKP